MQSKILSTPQQSVCKLRVLKSFKGWRIIVSLNFLHILGHRTRLMHKPFQGK
jgi:hypothetical protein